MLNFSIRAAAVAAAVLAVPVSATVLVSQEAGNKAYGWCSSCNGLARGFATFSLADAATLQTAKFTAYAFQPTGNTVSIWSDDGATQLFELSFAGVSGIVEYSVSLPNVQLAAGNYLFSVYNATNLGWMGTQVGDSQYHGTGDDFQLQSGTRYYSKEYSLELDGVATAVPEPGLLGLFGLGAIGLGLSRRRRPH